MKISELKSIALKADAGPWKWIEDELWGEGKPPWDSQSDEPYREPIIKTDMGVYGPNAATRAYIAAVSPGTVLALIEIIEKAGIAFPDSSLP